MDAPSDFSKTDASSTYPGKNQSSQELHEESPSNEQVNRKRMKMVSLYKAVREGNLQDVRDLLGQDCDAMADRINVAGDRVLHIAVLKRHVKIVEELVRLARREFLTIQNDYCETALTLAAAVGIKKIAKLLVEKNNALLGIANMYGNIPVVVAAQLGHKDMVHFLYNMTLEEDLNPSKHGARLLTFCISTQLYDIALDIIRRYPELSISVLKESAGVLNPLATAHSAFRSGKNFVFWQRWIYSYIRVQGTRGPSNIFAELGQFPWNFLKLFVPSIKHIYETKLENAQARDLLSFICKKLLTLPDWKIPSILFKPVLTAALRGNVEFISEVAKTHPDVLWVVDAENGRPLFSYAVSKGLDEVYSFLLRLSEIQCLLNEFVDNSGNTILHQAALLSTPRQLGRIPGPALQMQRELQWFEEVQKIVPSYKEAVNKEGQTPRDLFTEEHKQLVIEGEKWMKETATSCTVVSALIVTIMFAAAFTVPGGYEADTGVPINLRSKYFILFMMSDALSLFFSSTSVLVFLGILTSLYREEDFLKSLPTKLIIGLSTLFFSIAAMMIAFSATIVMTLSERFVWISMPMLIAASIPVTFFALLQFPLLIQIFRSTYGRGIFYRSEK